MSALLRAGCSTRGQELADEARTARVVAVQMQCESNAILAKLDRALGYVAQSRDLPGNQDTAAMNWSGLPCVSQPVPA